MLQTGNLAILCQTPSSYNMYGYYNPKQKTGVIVNVDVSFRCTNIHAE